MRTIIMREYPNLEVDYGKEELEKLNPKAWQLNQLRLNPDYCSWGNYEDYMSSNSQWGCPIELDSFDEAWGLNDLNEMVNFYFEIYNENGGECKLGIQMWFIHPRKGSSRGVIIKEIKESELPDVYSYLIEARNRNFDRFSKIEQEVK